MSKVAVLAGAGPGNGAAISRRLVREGYAMGVLARSQPYVDELAAELRKMGGDALPIATDLGDPEAVANAFKRIRAELGSVDVLIQNAAPMVRSPFMELKPELFEMAFRVAVMGMVHCCREVLGDMEREGSGSIVVIGATGAMRGAGGFAPFAVGKFGQRALGQSLAREFGPKGIHVAHVIIDGVIETPATRKFFPDKDPTFFLQPEDIADAVWHVIDQPRSAWSQEIDLRPFGERF